MPGRQEMTVCNPSLKDEIGIYAPQIKPYPELMIVPTAEICPCEWRKKLITDESAFPNNTKSVTSNRRNNTSKIVMYQPTVAI